MAEVAAAPAGPQTHKRHASLLHTLRRAAPWWLLPATVVTVLGFFAVYTAWSVLAGGNAEIGPYLSPFWSPKIAGNKAILGPFFGADFILLSPLLFRGTCYYYRKAYYRSFFWDPPACAMGELRHRHYRGESKPPMVLNNLHRFAMYVAVVILGFLWYDAALAFNYHGHWGFGLGTAVLLVNVVFLTGYTFGCHSLRHLVGGRLDCYSRAKLGAARNRAWRWVTLLNERHPMWAWISLFSVLFSDIYIRLVMHFGWAWDPHIGF